MKKIYIYIGITFMFLSCDENLSEYNVDPKNPVAVNAAVLFTSGEYNLVNQLVNIDYNHNVDRLWANYLTQTTYIQESSYDAANRDIGGSIWDNIYTETLQELSKSKEILRAEEVVTADEIAERDNKLAMVTVLEVFAWQYLVDNFGPVPFDEALNIENVTPAYTDGSDIYFAIADSLQSAIASFDAGVPGFDAGADLLYGGDIAKWQKFANSLLLKLGMRIADVNPTTAEEWVTDAVAGGVFESNDDNASLQFIENQPYTNPIYDYFVVDNRNTDFVATQFFLDMLQALDDPRIDPYFDENIESGYVGGEYGAAGNAYAELTHVDPMLVEPTYPGTIMDYASVEFFLAEAVERDFIAGDAEEHYNKAIRASFEYWGLTMDQADAYLAQPSVDYTTVAGDWREKIGIQKYIASYNQGYEAWTEARRLDFPELLTAASNNVPNPNRMIYPVNEKLINSSNYNEASSELGGDNTSSSIFWDVD